MQTKWDPKRKNILIQSTDGCCRFHPFHQSPWIFLVPAPFWGQIKLNACQHDILPASSQETHKNIMKRMTQLDRRTVSNCRKKRTEWPDRETLPWSHQTLGLHVDSAWAWTLAHQHKRGNCKAKNQLAGPQSRWQRNCPLRPQKLPIRHETREFAQRIAIAYELSTSEWGRNETRSSAKPGSQFEKMPNHLQWLKTTRLRSTLAKT